MKVPLEKARRVYVYASDGFFGEEKKSLDGLVEMFPIIFYNSSEPIK